MNDLHFYFTTARARYCFYYFIVNANKKNETLTNHTSKKAAKFVKQKQQESFVVEAFGEFNFTLLVERREYL